MVSVSTTAGAQWVRIIGFGIGLEAPFGLTDAITLESKVPKIDLQEVAAGSTEFFDYAATLNGNPIATFSLIIHDQRGPKDLAIRAWNSLWTFHLLSLACSTPCRSLYSVSKGERLTYGHLE